MCSSFPSLVASFLPMIYFVRMEITFHANLPTSILRTGPQQPIANTTDVRGEQHEDGKGTEAHERSPNTTETCPTIPTPKPSVTSPSTRSQVNVGDYGKVEWDGNEGELGRVKEED